MGEPWRRKTYYRPRVLIETEHVLTPLFGDSLVCLTGGELYMLRAMCQYLHRRSTFVTQYEQQYYLAPTEEEWDDLDAAVAELEGKLMGCSELEAMIEQIRDCVCQARLDDWPSGGIHEGQRDYDDYQSEVEYEVGDPPEEFEDWDEWTEYKCKAAQRIVDDITGLGEKLEVLYSTGAVITFSVFQYLVLGTAIAPPVALALTIIAALAAAGTALAMVAFQQWCEDNKDEIVCCIFNADTEPEAYAAVQAYIDGHWDLLLGIPFGQALFNHDVISKCFDGGLDVSGYSATYCAACGEDIVQGDGWYARVVPENERDWILTKGGSYDDIIAYLHKWDGEKCIGFMYNTIAYTGGWLHLSGLGCDIYHSAWGPGAEIYNGGELGDPRALAIKDGYVEETEVRDALYPNSTIGQYEIYEPYQDDYVCVRMKAGNGSNGQRTIRFYYLIFVAP